MTTQHILSRGPAVAGHFYPGDPMELARVVTGFLRKARQATGKPAPKALVAPHAGYVYSGAIAASAYALLAPVRDTVKRVVLLGPTHRVAVRGIALPGCDRFDTPLGPVMVDKQAIQMLSGLRQIVVSPQAHALEHSLEVHVPFLQSVLSDFMLVPLAVGHVSPADVAEVVERLWGGPETLIVVSSDLSHYLPYDQARALDQRTADAIVHLDTAITHEQACGATPVAGLSLAARAHGLKAELVDLRNSGDTAGDRSRVVGYGSFAYYGAETMDPASPFPLDAGATLLALARGAIARQLGKPAPDTARPSWLAQPGASFITLKKDKQLRGCIGSLQAHRPLGQDVETNAAAAAFRDPRFKPLTADEYESVSVEVSLLSPMTPFPVESEADALAKLRPGVDGLVFQYGHHTSTFLPQVWDEIPEPRSFLIYLKRKAGLPPDFWDKDVKLFRYTVSKWRENTD
jgi:AmmeMemoRadiSam system protein B/AmmeMemoRadiSam system protein A